MSVFEEHKDEIEHFEQLLGAYRGRLAVTLDRLTNAMVLVGQHGVYCHSQRDATKPTMDIQIITGSLQKTCQNKFNSHQHRRNVQNYQANCLPLAKKRPASWIGNLQRQATAA